MTGFRSPRWTGNGIYSAAKDMWAMIVINARTTLITAFVAMILFATDTYACEITAAVSSVEMV
jgi:hypothetical protein